MAAHPLTYDSGGHGDPALQRWARLRREIRNVNYVPQPLLSINACSYVIVGLLPVCYEITRGGDAKLERRFQVRLDDPPQMRLSL